MRYNINFYVSTLTQIVLLVNVILYWKGNQPFRKEFRFFWCYLLLGLAVQVAAKVVALQGGNNLPLLHFYTLFEFVFLSLFYNQFLNHSERSKRNFNYFVVGISCFIILNSIIWQPLTRFNSNAKTATQIIYIGYAIYYFFKAQSREDYASSYTINLLNSGLLVYYAASLFIFMFSNVLMKLGEAHNFIWVVNTMLYLGLQLLIFYWIWNKIFRQTKST